MDDYKIIIFYFVVMILSLTIGYICNKSFDNSVGRNGFQIIPGIVQSGFIIYSVLNIPNPDITQKFIVGLIGVFVSYIIGIIWCCKVAYNEIATGMEYIKAIIAQIFIPIGSALLIVYIVALLFNNKKKKRR